MGKVDGGEADRRMRVNLAFGNARPSRPTVIPSPARDLYKNVVLFILEILRLRFAPFFGSQGTLPCNAFALLRASARVRLKRRAHFTPCKQGKISRAFEMTQGLIPLPLIRQTAAPFDTFPAEGKGS